MDEQHITQHDEKRDAEREYCSAKTEYRSHVLHPSVIRELAAHYGQIGGDDE